MTSTPSSAVRRRLRIFGLATSVVLVVLLGAALWAWLRFQRTLPQLEGGATLPGLAAAVTVERDGLGVPTLRGGSRVDLSRALGYVHGQDRFFQMDLTRRRAAGELAALFGPAALPLDRGARLHEFRALSRRVLERITPEELLLLQAYAAGVNAALAAFPTRPWEYAFLRATPEPWTPEDSVLCVYSMALDLQDENGVLERTLLVLRETYGSEMVAFFAPTIGPDDAAIDGTTAPLPPLPSSRWIDLRRKPDGSAGAPAGPVARATPASPAPDDAFAWGSNSFGLAGRAGSPAMLQNDMHLGLSIPPIWYRARLLWTEAGTPHDVVGVTLPGAPAVVVGSNGAVAWGFTNSNTDTGDLVLVQPDAALPESLYTLGNRPVEFEERRHTLEVKGGAPETLTARWTAWGPVVGENREKKPLAHKWTMHDPDAVNFRLIRIETARNVTEALAVMREAGIPPQNALVADRQGELAWTIAGRLPRRTGLDGRLPISWAFGDRGWRGFLDPSEIPVRRVSNGAPLWTANQRVIGGPELALLGNGGYDPPYRAARIRDLVTALAGREPAATVAPAELLAVALDDRNLLLDRWQRLLQSTLTPEAVSSDAGRAELRGLTEAWEGRATPASAAYHLVRTWRLQVAARALTPLFAPCTESWSGFNFRALPYEHALWAILDQRPLHFLPAEYARWEDLLLAAADDVIAGATKEFGSLAGATWGKRNTVRLRHPFSRALPAWLGSFIDLPAQPLPGDSNTPRAQSRSDGASQRLVVAPGRESEGLFHMPGGQSGHPLSPYYRTGHAAWAAGEPTPLLPGPAVHTLVLAP